MVPTSDNITKAATQRIAFSPEIDGLRAMAIVLGLLYHTGVPGFGGGFTVMGVFFSVSGFLITSLLLAEREKTGSVRLLEFYGRRFRRLLPAAALVLAATAVAARFLYHPLQIDNLRREAVQAILFVSNWGFAASEADYLNSDLIASPLQHFWSLSVEEQYYALWPALVLMVCWRARNLRLRVGLAAGAVVLTSLALSVRWTAVNAADAYFLTPSRAWEFAAGALLACVAPLLTRIPAAARAALGWAGFLTIVAAAVLYSEAMAFPGLWGVVPVLGTLAVLTAGQTAGGPRRVLSSKVAGWLGQRSYALYLWHWPVLILTESHLGRPLRAWETAVASAGFVVLAVLTFRLVEDPVRRTPRLTGRPVRSVGVGVAVSLTAFAAAAVFLRTPDLPGMSSPTGPEPFTRPVTAELVERSTVDRPLPDDLRPKFTEVRDDLPDSYGDGCHLDYLNVEVATGCVYGDADSRFTVALIGDSHASHWFTPLRRIADTNGWRMLNFTKDACPYADVDVYLHSFKRPYRECRTWQANVLDRLTKEQPDLLVLAHASPWLLDREGRFVDGEQVHRIWDEGMRSALGALDQVSDRMVVLLDTPTPGFDVVRCLAEHTGSTAACDLRLDDSISPTRRQIETAAAADAGARVVDTTRWLCAEGTCPAVIGSVIVYRETHHLTDLISSQLTGLLEAELTAALAGRAGS